MKKLILSSSVALALGLAGCGNGESIDDINNETETQTPISRIVFDPAEGNINVPNDLVMIPDDGQVFDYTLNIPVADPTDFGDPQNAMNILDGWSIQHPFVIDIQTAAGVALDESTLSAGIHLFEATLGVDQRDPDCADLPIPSMGCKLGDELTYGVDFVLSLVDDNTVSVVPLKPLKPAQGHMLVMTTDLKDTSGKAVQGSTTWDLVRQDINTFPLATEDQLNLQTIVNSLVNPVIDAGYQREDISYVAAFTTQSTATVMQTVKQMLIADFVNILTTGSGDPASALPVIQIQDPTGGPTNAMEALGLIDEATLNGALEAAKSGQPAPVQAAIDATDFSLLQTCDGIFGTLSGQLSAYWGGMETVATGLSQSFVAEVGPFCAAQRYTGSMSLPYYSPIPTMTNPLAPMNDFWHAACDSGFVLGTLPQEVLAAATPGPNYELCSQVGLADLRLNGELIDTERNMTRYSPIPQPTIAANQLEVQVTIPDPAIAGALGVSITKPEAGWPVVMLVHGITMNKEIMMAISGTLSMYGIATVAIDLPLHGSRGFDVNGDGTDDLNASISPTHYMNLASLASARDNLRQSMADLLGLRLGLNAIADLTATSAIDLDTSSVSVMGVSLGAITGANFAALTNSTLGNPTLDAMFAVNAASLESPASGIGNFLMESPDFGPLIKALLLTESSEEFVAYVGQAYGASPTEEELREAFTDFMAMIDAGPRAEIESLFTRFTFAAQTVLDSGDPTAYAETLGANTPVHFMSIVGDGGANLPDQVNPVVTSIPLSGQHAMAGMIGLEQVTSTISTESGTVSGQVRFNSGAHASSLSPAADPAVTREMQLQIAGFIQSKAQALPITNTDVVAN